LNASASAWAPDNELSYVQSRGIFQSDIVLLVLNDGDLTQPRSSITDVGDNLPQKRPATAIGELYTRYLRPHIASVVATQDAGDAVAANGDQIARKNLADLDSFDDLVMRQNARLVLVYIPFRKDIPEAARASATALHLWSRAHRVPMIDLTSAEAPFPPGEITLDNGVHLNAEGHLVVARAIEQAWPKLVAATP
jgi:lysophospholipase L1-like esterase